MGLGGTRYKKRGKEEKEREKKKGRTNGLSVASFLLQSLWRGSSFILGLSNINISLPAWVYTDCQNVLILLLRIEDEL
jgi:hypothetical protein